MNARTKPSRWPDLHKCGEVDWHRFCQDSHGRVLALRRENMIHGGCSGNLHVQHNFITTPLSAPCQGEQTCIMWNFPGIPNFSRDYKFHDMQCQYILLFWKKRERIWIRAGLCGCGLCALCVLDICMISMRFHADMCYYKHIHIFIVPIRIVYSDLIWTA